MNNNNNSNVGELRFESQSCGCFFGLVLMQMKSCTEILVELHYLKTLSEYLTGLYLFAWMFPNSLHHLLLATT